MNIFTSRFAIPAVALVATFTLTAPALADRAPRQTVAVSHGDLDLTSTSGRAELERRIARAVKIVCAPAHEKQLKSIKEARACARETRSAAIQGLNQAIALAGGGRRVSG